MRTWKISYARITAASLAFASLTCMAQVNRGGWGSSELQYRVSSKATGQVATSTLQGWAARGPEVTRSFRDDASHSYREASVGDLLIDHLLGFDPGTSEATTSLRFRPTIRRDQIGVRLQIRF